MEQEILSKLPPIRTRCTLPASVVTLLRKNHPDEIGVTVKAFVAIILDAHRKSNLSPTDFFHNHVATTQSLHALAAAICEIDSLPTKPAKKLAKSITKAATQGLATVDVLTNLPAQMAAEWHLWTVPQRDKLLADYTTVGNLCVYFIYHPLEQATLHELWNAFKLHPLNQTVWGKLNAFLEDKLGKVHI